MKTTTWIPSLLAFLLGGCVGSAPLVTQWENTGGPAARNIASVLALERSPNTIMAGLTNGDVYVSTDAGQSWTKTSTIRPDATVYQLLEDPETGGRIYAATSGGAFVSSSDGKEWTRLPLEGSAPESLSCRVLAIDPWKPTVLYAGTIGHGLFRSTDAGLSWSPIIPTEDPTLSLADVYDIEVDLLRPDVLYAAVAPLGVVRSTDAGQTWSRVTEESTLGNARVTHILVNRKRPGELLYAMDTGNMFKSTDDGASWSPARRGDEFDMIHSLVVDAGNQDAVFAGTEQGIAHSTDFGSSWQMMLGAIRSVPVSVALGPSRDQMVLYAFSEAVGLQTTADGGLTWRQIDRDLGGSTVWLLRADRSGESVYAVAGRTVMAYDRETGAWLPRVEGMKGNAVHALAVDDDSASILYASTPAGVFRSVNSGMTWQPAFRKLSTIPLYFDTHPSIRTRLYASGEKGVFVSTDRGNSWVQAKPFRSRFTVRSLTFTPTNAGVVQGSTAEGLIQTTDGGFTWTPARFGLTADDIAAATLAADDPQTYFAWTTQGQCFRSTNRGLEWNQYVPPWEPGHKVHVAFDRYTPSSVVAVVDGKELYYSLTGGGTWTKVIDQLPPLDVVTVYWSAHAQVLYVGTKDRGVYRLPLARMLQDRMGE